jgi:uncharacterized protein (TIGR00369 family)
MRRVAAPGDEQLTEWVAGMVPYTRFIGMEVVAAEAEEVRCRLAWDAEKCTTGGMLHGGVLMGLADNAGGLCAFLNLPETANGTATIESKTNFFAPVSSGYVHAVTRPLHKGKRTIVVDTELRDDAGKLVARVTQTQAVL